MHFARPSEPRIQPREDILDRVRDAQRDSPVNAVHVAATMARNKPINRAFGRLGQAVLFDGGLSRRNVDLLAFFVTRPISQHAWTDEEAAILQAVDELWADDCIGDATWAACAAHFDDAEMIHLLMAAGMYRVVSGFLNSCGVQLDEGVPGWPTPPGSGS